MAGTILNSDLKADTKIYRTIHKDRLLKMFASGENALVRPSLWDDTFENYLLNSPVELKGEVGSFSFANDLYGQCWTLEGFSDAMWRIYSADKMGVRIRTTVRKLLDALSASNPGTDAISCFIGKVRYCTDTKLREFAENHFRRGFGTDGRKIAETLLIKRNAFRHEKEVRLIYLAPRSTSPSEDLLFHNFDCQSDLNQIMLHPQLSDSEATSLRDEIVKKTGFRGKVLHSRLYRLPTGFMVKIG
jgi:hypothetical protein